jgi:hypothetical protein
MVYFFYKYSISKNRDGACKCARKEEGRYFTFFDMMQEKTSKNYVERSISQHPKSGDKERRKTVRRDS